MKNVETVTRKQVKCKEWFKYRAGRVTASNFKEAATTNLQHPSNSLITVCVIQKVGLLKVLPQLGVLTMKILLGKRIEAVFHLNMTGSI